MISLRHTMVILLLFTVVHSGSAQKDSIWNVAQNSPDAHLRSVALIQLVDFGHYVGDSALILCEKAVKEATSVDSVFEVGVGHLLWAETLHELGRRNEALPHLTEAESRITKKNPRRYMRLMYSKGSIYGSLSRLDEAEGYLLEGLNIANQMQNDSWINYINRARSELYESAGLYKRAEEVYDQGIAYWKKMGRYRELAYELVNKGITLDKRNPDESIALYREGYSLLKLEVDDDFYTLSEIELLMAKYFVDHTNQVDSALLYLEKALTRSERINFVGGIIESHALMCRLLSERNELKKAQFHCDKAEGMINDGTAIHIQLDIVQGKKIWNAAVGDYKLAYQYQQRENLLSDSLSSAENVEKLTSQRLQFEFKEEKKKQQEKMELETLRREKGEANLAASKSKNLTLIAVLIASGLLLVFGIIFFVRLRSAKRTIEGKNRSLTKTISEKEILLKEIHHRVKNNLQLISSLLDLQAKDIDDQKIISVFEEGQNRVQAMSLIHQKLYMGDELSTVDFADYLKELTAFFHSLNDREKDTEISINCENIHLDIDTAIPVGLIVNELVTNAFKYGIQATGNLCIGISLNNLGDGKYELNISDNGPGLSEGFNWKKSKSLGMRLVQGLAKQLFGKITYSRADDATNFTVSFRDQFGRDQME